MNLLRNLASILALAGAMLTGAPVWANAVSGASPGAQRADAAGLDLGPWEAYLAWRLTPDLARIATVQVPEISWLRIDRDIVLPEFARALIGDRKPAGLSLFTTRLDRAVHFGGLGFDALGPERVGFERSTLLSGIGGTLHDQHRVNVSAVLASQQFSHSMLDLTVYDGMFRPVDFFAGNRELSQGAGLQFDIASQIAPQLLLDASFQSRINMDELASVRGVHGHAADLDIPSRLRMGLNLKAGEHTLFTVAVSQVFYSQVGAFPTRALPARFNALLGDSSSPRFEWDDLTVYSVGMRWEHENDLQFKVDFHTRSQPMPTSRSLVAALGDELAQHSVMVGLGKGLGERARLDLSASYAPPEFAFGGNVLGVVSDRLDQAVEVAARLNIRF